MADPQKTIDAALGAGEHDAWLRLEDDFAAEKKRAETNEARFAHAPHVFDRLYWDLRHLEEIAIDYRAAMNAVARGKSIDKDQHDLAFQAYTLAIGVVEHENDALDAAFTLGIVNAFALFPWVVMQKRASVLSALLEQLQKDLSQALREVNAASAKLVLNASLNVISALLPPLGILGRGAMFVGQWIVDDLLDAFGPQNSTTKQVADKAVFTVDEVADALQEIPKLGDATKRVARKAEKGAKVVGFLFDWDDLGTAGRKAVAIRALMAKAAKAYSELRTDIQRYSVSFVTFHRRYKLWLKELNNISEMAARTRRELENVAYKTGMLAASAGR